MAQPRVPFMAADTMREANVLWITFVGLVAGIIARPERWPCCSSGTGCRGPWAIPASARAP